MQQITNIENNKEDDEIKQSRKWTGRAMYGTWDGTGIWHLEDKTWNGSGPWEGGKLGGTWNVDGKWTSEGNDYGGWEGKGEMISNIDFLNHMDNYVFIGGCIINVIVSGINYFIGKGGDTATGIVFAVLLVLTIIGTLITRSTTKGKLKLKGSWKDTGEFRILDINGEWRLGYHTGTLYGKMKDRKPI